MPNPFCQADYVKTHPLFAFLFVIFAFFCTISRSRRICKYEYMPSVSHNCIMCTIDVNCYVPDSAARKINAAKFAARKSSVLLVTDLAARGIDIPLLG